MRRRNTQFKTFKACLASMKKADTPVLKSQYEKDVKKIKTYSDFKKLYMELRFEKDMPYAAIELADLYPDWGKKLEKDGFTYDKKPRTREKFTDADCVRLLNKETRKLGGIKALGSLFPPNADVTYTDLSKALVAIRTLSNSWSGVGVSQPIQRGLKDLNYALGVLYSEDTKKADEFAQWFLCELHDAYVKAKDTQIGKQGKLITRGIGKPVPYWKETESILKTWVPKFEGSFKPEIHISERGGVEEAELSIDPDTDFAKQDIGYQLAYDAHRWNSFSPERRAKQYLGMYNQTLKQALTEFQSAARSQGFGNKDAVAQFEIFRKGLAKRYRDVLSAKSRAPSSMVTGPARFPVKKANAAWERYRELFTDLAEYEKNAYKIAMKRFKKEKIKALGGIQELRKQEIDSLKEQLELMIAINKIAKSRKADSTKLKELSDLGISEKEAKIYITPDSYGEVGIASYTVANLRGRIRGRSEIIERQERKDRISELADQTIFDFPDGQIEYNFEEDRIQIRFGSYDEDGEFVTEKPSKEELEALKQKGLSSFRFAQTQNNAWQHNLTDRWIAATRRITGADIPSLSTLEGKGQQAATKDMTPEEKLKDIALEAKRVITEDAKRPDKITISDYGKVSGLHYQNGELIKIEKDGFEIVLKWDKKPYKRDINRIEKAIMKKIRERDREAIEVISGGAWFPNDTMIAWKMEYPKEEKKPTKKRTPKADLPKITGDQFVKRIESIIKGHWPMSAVSVRIPKKGYLGAGNVEINFTLGSGKEQYPNRIAMNDPIRIRMPIQSSRYGAGVVDDKGNIRSGDLEIEADGAKRLTGSGWSEKLSWRNAKKQNYEQIYKRIDTYFGKTLKDAVIKNKDRLPYTNLKKSNPYIPTKDNPMPRRRRNFRDTYKRPVLTGQRETSRKQAEDLYVYPKLKKFPIGDEFHARLALIYVMSPNLSKYRKKVIQAVKTAYPDIAWGRWWNSHKKDHPDLKNWGDYVNGMKSNPRKRSNKNYGKL